LFHKFATAAPVQTCVALLSFCGFASQSRAFDCGSAFGVVAFDCGFAFGVVAFDCGFAFGVVAFEGARW